MMPMLHSVGRVAGKHGYSGEISIVYHLEIDPAAIQKGNFLFIEFDGKGVPFLIESVKSGKAVVKLTDIRNERDAAELEGRNVLLENGEESEARLSDLSGYTLYDGSTEIGLISDVESYPAGDMLIVNSSDREILIPFVEDWIRNIDVQKRIVEMDLPEGITDLYS